MYTVWLHFGFWLYKLFIKKGFKHGSLIINNHLKKAFPETRTELTEDGVRCTIHDVLPWHGLSVLWNGHCDAIG